MKYRRWKRDEQNMNKKLYKIYKKQGARNVDGKECYRILEKLKKYSYMMSFLYVILLFFNIII